MAPTVEIKRDRLHLRLDARTKHKLERAAAFEETSVSDFVLTNALAAADRVIASRDVVALKAEDWEAFHDALVDPPKPNRTLKSAVRWYRDLAK